MNEKHWPNFFVVGAGRAGTTSLWHYLRQHPDVFMPAMKETHFFSDWKPGFQPIVTSEKDYLKLFQRAGSARAVGEATPSYLRARPVAGRIKAAVPDARIIILVRHPIDRAWSSYWHARRYARERRPFGEVLEEGLRDPSVQVPFIVGSLYAESVRRYLDLFGGDQVLVLVFEEFVADPRTSMREVYRFLEVDPGFADHVRLEILNPYSKPRNGLVARFYSGRSVRFLAKRVLPLRVQHRAERVALARDGKPALEPRLRRLIAEACIEDVQELETILGRQLPWDLERELAQPV